MNTAAQLTITIDVSKWSDEGKAKALQAINAISAEEDTPFRDEPTAWTEDLLKQAKLRLKASGAHIQVKAIESAIGALGKVNRAEVYVLGDFGHDRSLKGFTRPCNRVTKEMKDEGLLPVGASELLVPLYDEHANGYSRAQAFVVPKELVWGHDAKSGPIQVPRDSRRIK